MAGSEVRVCCCLMFRTAHVGAQPGAPLPFATPRMVMKQASHIGCQWWWCALPATAFAHVGWRLVVSTEHLLRTRTPLARSALAGALDARRQQGRC